ncbi:MAG: ATP-binding protein [Candidatus Eisenbacteria bacterium]|nr:ATP-binding protein [Candidatus Eisenbacteria bacterium]
MEDLSLHILDIVENSIRANAKNVEIKLTEYKKENLLILEINDDGQGMDDQTRKQAMSPFFTTKERKKTGLGLSFLAQSAEESGGKLKIDSGVGKGTKVTATFGLNHIDRKPLGKLDETMKCLRVTHPEINLFFNYAKANNRGGR